ncbi:AAA family ATPase [Acinetobacter pittii]|uniref:AbiJ-related protein n=1 Tax=Acinetobacter pittii TaxID=48296 RepID=UPI0026F0ABDC|nr:AAA family ATPase [Acinetobacter pittii]MDO7197057.1 AAA family ATPase [Acinetobacter pittii]
MKNLQLSKNIKIEILKLLAQQEERLFQKIDAVSFFDSILNLRAMPSTDARFQDARRDLQQHYMNNSDWTLEEILLDRYDFTNSDENFFKLLNLVVSPIVHNTEEEVKFFYYTLNPILNNHSLEYRLKSINEYGISIFELDILDNENQFKDIVDNYTPIFVNKDKDINIIEKLNISYPSYILLNPTTWDDYSSKNQFILSVQYKGQHTTLGLLKIISIDSKSTTLSLPYQLTKLGKEYCSLGEKIDYYKSIKNFFGNHYLTILKAFNDVAFFPQISEAFENSSDFKNSLIRFDGQEQLMRQARYIIDNYDLSNLYSFEYLYTPSYSDDIDALKIPFNFNDNSILPNRIYALIGENGVGKTQLVSKLPIDLANQVLDTFTPRMPLFSKVIAVSYSIFDDFKIPESSSKINYVYCGLRQERNGEKYTLTKSDLKERFFNSIQKVQRSKRFDSWCEIVKNFFSNNTVDQWKIWNESELEYKLNITEISNSLNKFSSGQSIFVFILTEILANIRYDSLIIFDEPETHLHPNAISQLINSIHLLVRKFQSYCIIATHSPIIVQGILSKNVYVVRNENNILSAKHPSIETFGENLTKITDDIFGARDTTSQFKNELKILINKGYSYNEIISLLKTNNVPLSLNLTVLLNSMVSN